MASQKRSAAFLQFLAGVDAPITFSNLDEYEGIGALHQLKGAERTEAEDVLIERLALDDGRAAKALADIDCRRAIEPLRRRLSAVAAPMMRVFAARALLRLGDDSGRAAAIEVFRTGNRYERLTAVGLLGELRGDDVEAALEAAFADPDTTLRSAAVAALIKSRGLDAFDNSYRDLLGLIRGRLLSPLATVRAEALAELREVFARHRHGESPRAIGLDFVADDEHEPLARFVASLESREPPWQDDFALDGLDGLTGRERKWVEDMLLNYLPRDPRAARALARLHVERAVEPLRELAQAAEGELLAEAVAAASRLTGGSRQS